MNEVKDYRVTVKVRNNRILEAAARAGIEIGPKWCERVGLTYPAVNSLVNMTEGPLLKDGDMRPLAIRLCEELKAVPTDLWSPDQLYPLDRNTAEVTMDAAEVQALLESSEPVYAVLDAFERTEAVQRALKTLTPREQAIISMRFGLDGATYTQGEVARMYDLTSTRVKQLEHRALRKLRHPSRALEPHSEGFIEGQSDAEFLEECQKQMEVKQKLEDYERKRTAQELRRKQA